MFTVQSDTTTLMQNFYQNVELQFSIHSFMNSGVKVLQVYYLGRLLFSALILHLQPV